jgi:hypothetical protein
VEQVALEDSLVDPVEPAERGRPELVAQELTAATVLGLNLPLGALVEPRSLLPVMAVQEAVAADPSARAETDQPTMELGEQTAFMAAAARARRVSPARTQPAAVVQMDTSSFLTQPK